MPLVFVTGLATSTILPKKADANSITIQSILNCACVWQFNFKYMREWN